MVVFTMDGNQISELPSSIAKLNSLEYLMLNGNQLKEIPEDIVKMNISALHLEKNLLPAFYTINAEIL